MKKFFTVSINKIVTSEEYKNRLGHNNRKRNYNSPNIDKEKSERNITLYDTELKTKQKLLEFTKSKLGKGKRQIKEDSAAAFEIIIDTSKEVLTNEEDRIKYLKESFEYLKTRFKGQKLIHSIIHMDEGKPHLQVIFSYFNDELGQWNQKQMYKKGVTDINKILIDFENQVGKKYGLEKGKSELEKIQETPKEKTYEVDYITETGYIKDTKKRIKGIPSPTKIKQLLETEKEYKKLKTYIDKTYTNNEKEINAEIQKTNRQELRNKAIKVNPIYFLHTKGKIQQQTDGSYLIQSPFREDDNPSLSIFQNQDGNYLIHDFTDGKTINTIDAYMKLFNTTYDETIQELTNEKYKTETIKITTQITKNTEKDTKDNKPIPKYQIEEKRGINKVLDTYLRERNIIKIPNELKEIGVTLQDGSYYYSLGLKNDSSGYASRNKIQKMNYGKQDITTINNNKEETIIVEGMFDYLSYYQRNEDSVNYIVLNSVTNITPQKLLRQKKLLENTNLILALDNDDGGRIGINKIKEMINTTKKIDIPELGKFKDPSEKWMDSQKTNCNNPTRKKKQDINITDIDIK